MSKSQGLALALLACFSAPLSILESLYCRDGIVLEFVLVSLDELTGRVG